MLDSTKYFLKKYWGILVLSIIVAIPLIYICATRTNKGLILKGDTTIFTNVVDVNSDYNSDGTFRTVYVIDMEKSTVFQNFLATIDPEIETYTMSKGSAGISYYDSYFAGKIQYASSIDQAIILAYETAKESNSNISIDYSFSGYTITYHGLNSQFSIGDRVVGIKKALTNDAGELLYNEDGSIQYSDYIEYTNESAYKAAVSSVKVNDIWYLEDGTEIDSNYKLKTTGEIREITLGAESFGIYPLYDINYDTITPSLSLNSNYIGGPSGGLLQTLSIYNELIESDLTYGLDIAGTGTISVSGKVGAIGGIKEKIPTAIDDGIDVFFCPEANYDDAYEKYKSIRGHSKMALVKVSTFSDAISYLKEVYENA